MALSKGFDWNALKGVDWQKIDGLEPWERTLKQRFPALAWVLDHDELAPVIRKAVEQKWTEETFQANLQATQWWTSRTESQRQWDIFADDDSNAGELADRMADTTSALRREAALLGVRVAPDRLEAIARSVLRNTLGDAERIGLLLAQSPEVNPGAYTAEIDGVEAMARRYMVSVSPEQAERMARRVLTGELDETNIEQSFQELAKQRHPSLRALIEDDVAPEEFFRPHRERLGQMLGRDATDIDLLGEFSAVIGIGDGREVRPMSVAETERYARSLDDYWERPGGEGEQEMYGFFNQLSRSMGVRR